MLTPQQIQQALEKAFPGAKIAVNSPDFIHFEADVCAPQFKGLTRVTQQQKVYAVLGEWIQSGALHAIALKTAAME